MFAFEDWFTRPVGRSFILLRSVLLTKDNVRSPGVFGRDVIVLTCAACEPLNLFIGSGLLFLDGLKGIGKTTFTLINIFTYLISCSYIYQ